MVKKAKRKSEALCDTALGAYDAEQTNRSSSCLWGVGFPPNAPYLAHWRPRTSAGQGWPSVPVAKDGEKGPCALPRIWGRFRGVCYSAYVKTSRLCDTASRAGNAGRNGTGRFSLALEIDGTFHVHRHAEIRGRWM